LLPRARFILAILGLVVLLGGAATAVALVTSGSQPPSVSDFGTGVTTVPANSGTTQSNVPLRSSSTISGPTTTVPANSGTTYTNVPLPSPNNPNPLPPNATPSTSGP